MIKKIKIHDATFIFLTKIILHDINVRGVLDGENTDRRKQFRKLVRGTRSIAANPGIT